MMMSYTQTVQIVVQVYRWFLYNCSMLHLQLE